jgi:hypothetical protein
LRYAGVALGAALCAALLAHVAIDVAGDYLLPHDSYDDIAHDSRAVVACAVLGLVLGALGCAVGAALRRARGSEFAFCAGLRDACPPGALQFAITVNGLTFLILGAMEALDVTLAGGRIDDVGDLFGGSLLLGGLIAALCALAAAFGTRVALHRLARLGRIARRVAAFLRRRTLPSTAPGIRRPRRRSHATSRYIARRLAGRAPPHSLLATTASP